MLIDDLTPALTVGRHLDDLGVVWLIGGSVASSLLGEMRATADIDLVADLRLAHVAPLYARLSPEFYVDEDTMRWAARERRSFNAIHEATMTKVDVFCVPHDEISQAQLSRRIFEDTTSARVPIASPEDIILQKLIWYRTGGEISDRQWKDIVGVIRVHGGALDREYLVRQARAAGVDDLLQRLLAV